MCALVAVDDLPNYVPGRIWVDTAGRGWDHVALRGYEYGPTVSPPDLRIPEYMLVLYMRGETQMHRRVGTAAGRREEWAHVGPGDISLQACATVGEWSWEREIDVLHIYLDQSLVDHLAEALYGPEFHAVRLRDQLKVRDDVLTGLGHALVREAQNDLPGSRLYARSLSEQLTLQLLRHHFDVARDDEGRKRGFDRARQRQIRQFIAAHLGENLTLPRLAEVAGMSTQHFARLFRSTFRMAPHQYVLHQRLERARELLADGGQSIAAIADRLGFADPSHLTRCFKRRFGVPPRRWRRAHEDAER